MGLFGKKVSNCPICDESLPSKDSKLPHWTGHAALIESGEGAGNFTWFCSCGRAPMYWEKDYQAGAALMLHMKQRHAIPM